jgi:hypothetical protein
VKDGLAGAMKFNEWKVCLQNGTKWEKKLMEKIGRIIKVKSIQNINYQHNPEIQRKGIDGLISLEQTKVESKSRSYDYYKYSDILIETISVRENNKPGWFYTTQADIVAYVWENPSKTNLLDGYLIFITPELRNWFDLNKHRFKTKIAYSNSWSTENKAVPIKEFPRGSLQRFNPYIDITEQSQLTIFNKQTEVNN